MHFSAPPARQIGLRQVAKLMVAEHANLQGLAEVFACLDMQGSGKIPLEAVHGLLASGNYELSEVEVGTRLRQCSDLCSTGHVLDAVQLGGWVCALGVQHTYRLQAAFAWSYCVGQQASALCSSWSLPAAGAAGAAAYVSVGPQR